MEKPEPFIFNRTKSQFGEAFKPKLKNLHLKQTQYSVARGVMKLWKRKND